MNPCECGQIELVGGVAACPLCRAEWVERQRQLHALALRREQALRAKPHQEPKYWFGSESASPITRCENFRCRGLGYVRDMAQVQVMVEVAAKGFETAWKQASKAERKAIPSQMIPVERSYCMKCVASRDAKGGRVFDPAPRAYARDEAYTKASAELREIAKERRDMPWRREAEPTVEDLRAELASLRKGMRKR